MMNPHAYFLTAKEMEAEACVAVDMPRHSLRDAPKREILPSGCILYTLRRRVKTENCDHRGRGAQTLFPLKRRQIEK